MNKHAACRAYLGFGANLGDPLEQIINARSNLMQVPGISHGRCSRFYMSSPVGYDKQPNFINCVLEVETELSALQLLDVIQTIENDLGRSRVAGNQNAPRVIDIDLLLFGDQRIDTARLIVPHPRITERLFVLHPLLELLDSRFYQDVLVNGDFKDQELTVLSMTKNDQRAVKTKDGNIA